MKSMMRCYFMIFMMIHCMSVSAQYWTTLDPSVDLSIENDRDIFPIKYHLAQIQMSESALRSGSTFDLPLPDGTIGTFVIQIASNFHPKLAARYPRIRTFSMEASTDPQIRGRMDFSRGVIHAVIKHPHGDVYIDPVLHHGQIHYISYYTADYQLDTSFLSEYLGHDHSYHDQVNHFKSQRPQQSPFARSGVEPVELFQYDLALSCTGEYAQKHGGTVEGALAAMNTALNRINFVFESELAIQLRLIENNDTLIHLDGTTDPFTNGNASQLALENSNFLLSRLGSSNYDVGHVFATQCSNIVGVSGGVGTVCTGNKGFGSSCEVSTTDRFYIGIVCHELGHQFGAEHTWNNCPNASDTQFNSGTAFEPGSGSTIMSYGGACGDQNIVNTVDFYYHSNSLEDILFYSKSSIGKNCAEVIATGNHQPTVEAGLGQGLTIPISTPFRLTASGDDIDGDELTYVWEQFDAGIGVAGMKPLTAPQGNGPIFRSIPPSSTGVRFLPSLASLVANSNSLSEVLPTYARNLTFRVTVRDRVPEGGGVAWDELRMKVTDQAGPFIVESFNESDTLTQGSIVEINWDVANTNMNPVNCQLVDILLSSDGGFTYGDTLAAGVFNDGAERVTIPNLTTEQGRVMIAAADQIFFDINDAPIVITEAELPGFAADIAPHNQMLCLPTLASLEVESFGLGDFSDTLELVAINVPAVVAEIPPQKFLVGEPLKVDIDFTSAMETTIYEIEFSIRSATDTISQIVLFQAVSNDFSDLSITGPNGVSGVAPRPELTWTPSTQASGYRVEISTSPAFDQDLLVAENLPSGVYELESLLAENTLYYWRVRPENICGSGPYSPVAAFHTLSLVCNAYASEDIPVNISQNNVVRRTSALNVPTSGIISDINVTSISGFHESFGDLIVELESPEGTLSTLFSKQCGFSNRSFDVGFDDDAASVFDCQTNLTGQLFRPQQDLSVYLGEEIEGDWTLIVHDSVAGSGGRIEGWSLELCGSIFPEPPVLIASDTLRAGFAANTVLNPDHLQATDDLASANELIYTLVSIPGNGVLMNRQEILITGSQFSQADIDGGQISYSHTSEDSLPDKFTFTLLDGDGGWLGIEELPIQISRASVSTNQFQRDLGTSVVPNPSSGSVLMINRDNLPLEVHIMDITGRSVQRFNLDQTSRKKFDLSHLPAGLYNIRFEYGKLFDVQKLVLTR